MSKLVCGSQWLLIDFAHHTFLINILLEKLPIFWRTPENKATTALIYDKKLTGLFSKQIYHYICVNLVFSPF